MPENITFRISRQDQHYGDLLEQRAQEEGLTPNKLAKRMLFASLTKDEGQDLQLVQEELRGVRKDIQRMRQGLGAAMDLLLTRGLSSDDAKRVREHLRELFGG